MKKKSIKSKKPVRPTKRAASESGDIIQLILQDHKPIKECISILKDPKANLAKKRSAFAKLEPALSAHAKAEEESLYVHLKQANHLRVVGIEGDTEHAIAHQLMKDINECGENGDGDGDGETDNDAWMAKVKVLGELVDHHVKEEEKDLMKAVRREFSSDERVQIGQMYSRLLKDYQDEGKEDAEPRKYTQKDGLRPEYD